MICAKLSSSITLLIIAYYVTLIYAKVETFEEDPMISSFVQAVQQFQDGNKDDTEIFEKINGDYNGTDLHTLKNLTIDPTHLDQASLKYMVENLIFVAIDVKKDYRSVVNLIKNLDIVPNGQFKNQILKTILEKVKFRKEQAENMHGDLISPNGIIKAVEDRKLCLRNKSPKAVIQQLYDITIITDLRNLIIESIGHKLISNDNQENYDRIMARLLQKYYTRFYSIVDNFEKRIDSASNEVNNCV